ncbi:MAG: twin-arginine translocase TatA/TatE family subunit [Spirochaetaceae bacterium]
MFGLGFWELVVLAVAALIFVPPSRLPTVFRKLGRVYGEIRAFNRSVRTTMRSIEREARRREQEQEQEQEDDERSRPPEA